MRSLTRIRVSAAAASQPGRTAVSAAATASRTSRCCARLPSSSSSSSSSASQRLYTTSSSSSWTAGPLQATTPRPYASVVPTFGAAAAAPPPEPMVGGEAEREAEDRAVRMARRKKHVKAGPGRFWKAAAVQEVEDAASTPSGASGARPETSTSGARTSASEARTETRTETSASEAQPGKHLEVVLDTRPLRHPSTRAVLAIPLGKRLLAHALAVEWDHLGHVRQAAQGHRMPLMSLVCRAVDLETERTAASSSSSPSKSASADGEGEGGEMSQGGEDSRVVGEDSRGRSDVSEPPSGTSSPLRTALIDNLLRYLDTDSLLCWAPPDAESDSPSFAGVNARDLGPPWGVVTLRQLQEQTAGPILAYLAAHVWPGIEVRPVLGLDASNALFPAPHPPEVRAAVHHWLWSLDGWTLAGVERATLAGKSLVTAARLVSAWAPSPRVAGRPVAGATRASSPPETPFTVDDAVWAANMETAFQTAQWGEVDDTHDVDKADLRRHFGSVVLLVQ